MNSSIANTTIVLLAAGHGKRMFPLTQHTPKPLLKVGKLTLIEHHLARISEMGFKHVVINTAYLAEQFPQTLGDGQRYGLNIEYSDESDTGALETAGGLKKALPLIRSDSFITINADIWTDYDFSQLLTTPVKQAKLVLVDNPKHNPKGDFHLHSDGTLSNKGNNMLTFSGIATYQKNIFDHLDEGKQALAPVFRKLISQEKLEGIKHKGEWLDIGTPDRLQQLQQAQRLK